VRKILIVDDDVDIIELVENRLKKNNYDVIFANDGDNGIKKALQEKPDLIIMDIMMPHLHGGEAVKLLKSYEVTKDIPILFFTAMNSYLPKSTELDQINVDGHLYPAITKPFEPNKLLASVKFLLGE
jgi:two-component system, OmpR family, alkaline phosphatase synthesis response regulator PhoP